MSEPPRAPALPGYDLGRVLGRGASSTVWSARRASDGLRCAVKVLTPLPGAQPALAEAALLERLQHDHVLRLHDSIALTDGRVALVVELARGGTLGALVAARGHLTPGEVVTVLSPLARALADLHGVGVVHGDVSPGNVLFLAGGKPVLADLGVSRVAGDRPQEAWGTGGFVAPEVLDGGRAGPAADAYAIGALAWLSLAGAPPGPAPVRPALATLVPDVPEAMADAVTAALAGDPSRRPTCAELALALFDAAPAEPVTLAVGADPSVGLTHRIRQTAAGVPGAGRPGAGPRAGAGGPTRRRWRPAAPLVALLVAVVVLCAGAGAGVRLLHERLAATPSGVVDTGPSGATAAASTGPREDAAPGAARRPVGSAVPRNGGQGSGPTSSGPGAGTVQTPEDSPQLRAPSLADPRAVLQRLVSARASAWRDGSPATLAKAHAPDSPALRRDRADLAAAAGLHVGYRGLDFVVRSAEVLPGSPATEVHLLARVDRSAYRLVDRQGRGVTVAAEEGERTVFTLRWTREGWRLADWAAPLSPG